MHNHRTAEMEHRIREAALDRTIAQSFPASDPPSTLPNPEDDTLLPELTRQDAAVAGRRPPHSTQDGRA